MADSKVEKARVLDAGSFDDTIGEDKPVLVDFYADWCGPCQMMAPVLDEMAKEEAEESFIVAKINIDENPDVAAKYSVMSIPTMIIFKGGKEAKRLVGVMPKEALKKELEEAK